MHVRQIETLSNRRKRAPDTLPETEAELLIIFLLEQLSNDIDTVIDYLANNVTQLLIDAQNRNLSIGGIIVNATQLQDAIDAISRASE